MEYIVFLLISVANFLLFVYTVSTYNKYMKGYKEGIQDFTEYMKIYLRKEEHSYLDQLTKNFENISNGKH